MELDHTVAEIASLVGGAVEGAPGRRLGRLCGPEEADGEALVAVWTPALLAQVDDSPAACLMVPTSAVVAAGDGRSVIRVDDPGAAVDALVACLAPDDGALDAGVHPTAVVDPTAEVHATARLGAHVSIAAGARVGAGARLHAGVVVGRSARIGPDCELRPRVVVEARCVLGARVLVHAGSVLGADGFGFRQEGGRQVKIPQVGRVEIGDDVEIGALCTVDRARLTATVVDEGTKLDDHVHIAHNCRVGRHCAIAGGTLLAGHAVLGDHVLMGGQSTVLSGVTVGARARIAGYTMVTRDVPDGGAVSGLPGRPMSDWRRQVAAAGRLPQLVDRVRRLEALVGVGDAEDTP